MAHQGRRGVVKIIEEGDSCQHAGLQHKYKEITHVSRRRAIEDARPLTMQYKVFHLLGEKFLSARQSDGR